MSSIQKKRKIIQRENNNRITGVKEKEDASRKKRTFQRDKRLHNILHSSVLIPLSSTSIYPTTFLMLAHQKKPNSHAI